MILNKTNIFFDLDRTLWDFDKNSWDTFQDIYILFDIPKYGLLDFKELYDDYQIINHNLWEQYRNGEIAKDFLNVERFYQALKLHNIDNLSLATEIAKNYIRISPTKNGLFAGTHEVLTYLKQKGYVLHIITNGFPEVQHIKLKESKLETYFSKLIISEEVGFKKPSKEIFDIALEMAGACAAESVMIGDDPIVDIKGAVDAGIEAIFVNHHNEPHCQFCKYQVSDLFALKELL
jgi:putative hydrolase of the HAD superfamily